MTAYEIIDMICDAVNPILFLVALCQGAISFWKKLYTKGQQQFIAISIALLSTYGLFLLDNWFFLWPQFDSDYSTHTAFALTMAITIALHNTSLRLSMAAVVVVYAIAMLYQNYHSVIDIVSTGVIVGSLFILLWQVSLKIRRVEASC